MCFGKEHIGEERGPQGGGGKNRQNAQGGVFSENPKRSRKEKTSLSNKTGHVLFGVLPTERKETKEGEGRGRSPRGDSKREVSFSSRWREGNGQGGVPGGKNDAVVQSKRPSGVKERGPGNASCESGRRTFQRFKNERPLLGILLSLATMVQSLEFLCERGGKEGGEFKQKGFLREGWVLRKKKKGKRQKSLEGRKNTTGVGGYGALGRSSGENHGREVLGGGI